MSLSKNLMLLLMVIALAVVPLWTVEKPDAGPDGEAVSLFGGADDKAKDMISEIAPDYKPWFEPLIEPASGEIASLLFALQAALGAGFIGYFLGIGVMRDRLHKQTSRT